MTGRPKHVLILTASYGSGHNRVAQTLATEFEAAGATAGVVLFSVFTHLMEVPLGALGWLLWTASPKVDPPHEGDEPAFVHAAP